MMFICLFICLYLHITISQQFFAFLRLFFFGRVKKLAETRAVAYIEVFNNL